MAAYKRHTKSALLAPRAPRAPRLVKQLPRIGHGGPPAGVSTSPNDRTARQTHPLIGADVDKVDAAMRAAGDGRPAQLQDLYDDIRDRTMRLDAVARTRTLVIQGRPWGVEPPAGLEQDREAQQIAANVAKVLGQIKTTEGGGWRSVVGQATDGILRGYAGFEIEWGVSAEGWHVPKRLHWRHPNRFVVGEDLGLQFSEYGTRNSGIPLDSWGPDKFAVHSPSAGRAAYITRRGVLLPTVFPALISRYGYRWWLKATERWGAPIPVLRHEQGGDVDALESEGLKMLRRVNETWNAVIWGGWALESIPGSGSVDPSIYTELVQDAATFFAIQLLGQNLTTEVQGGSFAATAAHGLVRQDILTGDLVELDDWVSAQIIEAIVRYNWPGAPLPVYVTEPAEPGGLELADVQEGLVTADEYRASKGLKPKKGGAEFREPLSEQQSDAGPGFMAFAAPPGGADAALPFEPRTTTSQTSEPSRSRRASELYESLAGSARSRHKPSSPPSPSRTRGATN